VHRTERGRRATRVIARVQQARRPHRILPAGVAVFAVAGTLAGTLAAMSGHPDHALSAAPAHAAAGTRPLFDLPSAQPSAGNLPVLSGALLTADSRSDASHPAVAPLRHTRQAAVLVVAPSTLPKSFVSAVSRMSGVTSAEQIEAVRMKVNGAYTPVLGVDPSAFRSYAAHPTAASDALWQGVANGGVAVSYTMGKMDKLPLGGTVSLGGQKTEKLRVSAFGTLGVGGVNAVVSDTTARSLGAPSGNALVISAGKGDVNSVLSAVKKAAPRRASVEPLVTETESGSATSGAAGSGVAAGPASSAAINVMLKSAMSRLGMPYVWGAEGPTQFDCSGLVQWSFARAGITMPRVAADQARTGPAVPVSQLSPGDLLFYHTDPTAPGYISHVAIYIGRGWMIQAPEPGKNVEVVPAAFGSEFAGAVRVNPAQAASVASGVA